MVRVTKIIRTFVCVDEHGNQLGPEETLPDHESFASFGLAQIDTYVSRLLQSSASFASLIIDTPDEQIAVSLWLRNGSPKFSVCVDVRSDSGVEGRLRQFFAERKLTALRDYLAGNGGISNATRCLSHGLPQDVAFITLLTKKALQDIYGLRPEGALNFRYREEHKTPDGR